MIYKNVNGTQKLVTNIRKPKKWRRFEYLQSSGTLWIDTGINPRVKPRVVAVLAMLNNADKDYWGNKSINGSAYYANFSAYKLTYYRYGSTTSQNVNYTVTQNSIHEWDVSDKVYVDGVLKFTSANTYTYNASQSTIQIFKAARSSYYSTYRLYSFKLYDGDTLVRDFVPAQYNGEYGLWDLIQNKFYGNKGTGTFTVGSEVGKAYDEIEKLLIPGDYTPPKGVEFYTYLQGDGLAYIDTNYLMNINCSINITMQLTAKVNQARMVGVQQAYCYLLIYSGDSGNNIKTYTKVDASSSYATLLAHSTNVHNYYINDTSHQSYADGTLKVTHTGVPNPAVDVDTCYLFWANGAAEGSLSTCRIYNCRIYNNNTLVRDLKPCTYNGVPGMWDMVNGVFYGNSGDGSFTLGTKVSNSTYSISNTLPLHDTLTYAEPDGSEWIHLFHHNNPGANIFASGNSFYTSVYLDANRWFDIAYCYKLPTFEFLLKQTLTSGGTEYKYRWVLNINPMVAGYNDVTPDKVTYNNSEGYTVPTSNYGGLCIGPSNTCLRAVNGNAGNWWGAIGALANYNSGIPSWNAQTVTTGCIDLYVKKINFTQEIPIWILKNALVLNGTAYINTGVAANNNTQIKVKAYSNCVGSFYFTGTRTGASGSHIFSLTGSVNGSTVLFSVNGSSKSVPDYVRVSTGYTFEVGMSTNGDSTYTCYFKDLNSNYSFLGDNISYTALASNTQNIFIFSNGYNIIDSTNKIYYYKIWQDNILVRDFVPATMGGRPGLYDKVNHKMYFNANSSGNFTVE